MQRHIPDDMNPQQQSQFRYTEGITVYFDFVTSVELHLPDDSPT